MDATIIITTGSKGLPQQEFNGKLYSLYPKERYFSRGSKRMHIAVWEFSNGSISKGFSIHHVNENTWDNRIENLQLKESRIHSGEHAKKRCEENKEWFNDFHSKGIESAKEWHKSDEGSEWHKEHAKKSGFGIFDFGEGVCPICSDKFRKKIKQQIYCTKGKSGNNCRSAGLRRRRKLEGGSI